MNSFSAFVKAIRPINLLIIAGTQYLIRWCVIKPIAVDRYELGLQMSELDFFLLVTSTVMIAAAGYLINDYFDLKIDRVNKPEKIIVGRYIKRRVAMGAHMVISILGILIGAYVSWRVGHISLVAIHIIGFISLLFYSSTFKASFLTGNLIIAFMAALVPLTVGLYEVPLLNAEGMKQLELFKADEQIMIDYQNVMNRVAFMIIGYAVFAFFVTLAREIVKDCADIKGDRSYGCKTLPIRLGEKWAQSITMGIYILIGLGLIYVWQEYLSNTSTVNNMTMWYILGILGPLFGLTFFFTAVAKNRQQFLRASNWNKIASLGGILYMLPWHFLIVQSEYQLDGVAPVVKKMIGLD